MSTAPLLRSFSVTIAALLLSLAAPSQAPTGGAAGGTIVGVVDVIKAVEQYPRYIKMRGELESRVKQVEAQLNALNERADELRGTIQVLAEGSQERADKEFDYKMLLQTRDYRRKAFADRVQLDDLRNTLSVYEDLEYVIGVVARRKKIGLILQKQNIVPSAQPIEDLAPKEVQARVQAYDRLSVWYASDEVDITGDVIKELMIPVPDRNSPERAPKSRPGDKE